MSMGFYPKTGRALKSAMDLFTGIGLWIIQDPMAPVAV